MFHEYQLIAPKFYTILPSIEAHPTFTVERNRICVELILSSHTRAFVLVVYFSTTLEMRMLLYVGPFASILDFKIWSQILLNEKLFLSTECYLVGSTNKTSQQVSDNMIMAFSLGRM